MRALFVNENIGGHRTVHRHLERALEGLHTIDAEFLHVPEPGIARRLVGATIPGLGRLDLDFQPLRSQLALSRLVRRRLRTRITGFDVLHVYTQNAALLSCDILRSHPSVVSVDSTNELNAYRLPQREPTRWTPKVLPATQHFERRVYDAATLVVASSAYAADSLRSTYGVPDERLRVLAMGIPVPEQLPPPTPHEEVPVITFVGRQLERKGGLRLLRLHREQLASRCVLELVTPEPVAAQPNTRVHHDIEVGDPRLDEILERSAVFVFPSEIDQSPNAVLEAMAAGLPVVALRVGALPEMVDDGVTGILVDPKDDTGLVDAITTLLDDPTLRAAMGAAGRKRVLAHYNVRTNARALVAILEQAITRFDAQRGID